MKFKEEYLQETLNRQNIRTIVLPIIKSDHQFDYRNTMTFKFFNDEGEVSLAMHDYLDYRIYRPITTCYLQSETARLIMKSVVDWANSLTSSRSNLDQLRIREGKQTGEFMVEIYTKSSNLPSQGELKEFLTNIPAIQSIYHCFNDKKRNINRRLIFGAATIREKIGKYTFIISPESFFQTNGSNVKKLYDLVKEFADVQMGDRVLDLFCGTGTIGIYLSTFAKEVIGIEYNDQAINDARANAKINNIKNISFEQLDLNKEQFSNTTTRLPDGQVQQSNVVIIDPPRAGLTQKLINELSKLINFKSFRLIYVSCDPATFARDAVLLEKQGLKLKKVQPVDMFPQTYHLEIVGLFAKEGR